VCLNGLASDTLAAALAASTRLGKADHEAAVTKAVAAVIVARTGAQSDLVPKTTVDQLCSTAKDLGINEGRAAEKADAEARLAEEKLATERTATGTKRHAGNKKRFLKIGRGHTWPIFCFVR
jgi:hypothetical protein